MTEWIYRRLAGNSWEATVYLGLANIALLAWARRHARAAGSDTNVLDYALWGTAVFCVLASGPTLHIFGKATIPLPEAVVAIAPFFRNLRAPSRVIVLVYVFIAVGVAYAYDILWQARRTRGLWSAAIAGMAALLVVFDFYPANNLTTTALSCSPGWAVIRDDPDENFGILDLPGGYEQRDAYMALQLCHGKPIVQGNTAREVVRTLRDRLEMSDILAQRNQLTANKIKYVVIHREPKDFFQWIPVVDGNMNQYFETYTTVYQDGELTVLKVY